MSDALNRRDFIGRAAGLAAAGAAFAHADPLAAADPSRIANALPRPRLAPDQPVRIGVIGTGGMGTEHARAFLRLVRDGKTNVEIAGVADVCQPRLEDALRKCIEAGAMNTIKAHSDYRRLLADPTVHGVLIAAPEHWHARIAEDAILAGKDVYIEKPMTLRLPEAMRLREVVRRNPGAIVVVGTQYVMQSSYREAQRLIAEGAIGKPVWSQTSYCRNSKDGEWLYYEIDPAWQPGVNLDWRAWCGPLGERPWNPEVYARWRRYRAYSTGIIGDLLVHRVTPLVQAVDAGWPTRVVASGGHYVDKAMENHDQVNINIEFDGEHTMIVAGSTSNEVGFETMVRGHKANLYFSGRRLTLRPERIYAEEIEEQTFEDEESGDAQDKLRADWIDCIRTREPPRSDVELGTKVMVVVDLATRSLWEGKAFTFDPDEMRPHAV